MTTTELLKVLSPYGFIEINDLILYVTGMNESRISHFEGRYIRDRLLYCLERHDSESDFFDPIRYLIIKLTEAIRD